MNIANIGVGVYTDLHRLHSGLRDGQAAVVAFAGAAATAFASVAAAAVAAGLAVDDAMDGIRIGTGATGKALADLENNFSTVFASVPDSAAKVSDAIADLNTRTGQTGPQLEALTTQILTLSRITRSDLNATVADSAKVFESWGIAVADQANSLDTIFRASQQTGIGVDRLLSTMVTAGPVFRSAGFDFATSAALLSSFEKAGVNGERAVASLTAAFRFFGKEGIDAKKGVEQTIARIQELGPGAAAAALGVKVFGRSAVDMVAAIQSGRLNVDALVASISNSSETIMGAARATDGFVETLAILRNNMVLALEPFGTALLGTFNTALVGLLKPSRALIVALDVTAKAAIFLGAVMIGRLVPAVVASTSAYVANAAAALVMASRMGVAALAARGFAGTLVLLRGALAFFGGPIGLAITVALTAIGIAFFNTGRKARQAAADAKQAADDFRAALAGMDEATLGAVGNTQRFNYGVLQRAAAQQEANMVRQRQIIEALQKAETPVPASGSGFVRTSAELTDAQQALRRQRQALDVINGQWAKTASNVRAVKEQEAALARQRASMPDLGTGGTTGTLAWEGEAEKAGRRYAEMLRERASLLTEVFEAHKAQGRDTASVMGELNRIYEDAATRLRAMGDATRLPAESLQDYRSFLGIVQQLSAASIAGPASVRQAPAASAVSTITVAPLLTGAERFSRIVKASAADFGSTVVQKMQQGRDAIKSGMVEGAREAAHLLQQASDNVRGMWAGLLSGMPQQLVAFASMFSALNEKRKQQEKDLDNNVDGATGPTGLAPFPGAVAFMLAAEALAPVLEAIRVPMAALLLPIQMVTAAFGPLLSSLLKVLFPIFKQFGISITYVAQVAGYVGGALLKVVGEIIRTVGSLIAKIPGLGQEGAAIKRFGKGLTDASKEMFDMAKAMPGVREELKNLDWDEAMKRAADSANALADSLTNVPEVFDLIARQTQAMRGQAPRNVPPLRQQVSVDLPDVLAVSASVASAAAVAGTTAAQSITSESVRWKNALVEGAELASSTLKGAAATLKEVLAGVVSRMRVTGEVRAAPGAQVVDSGTQRLIAQMVVLASTMAAQSERNAGYRVADYSSPQVPNPSSQTSGGTTVQAPVTVNLTYAPVINSGEDKRSVETLLRQERERLIRDLKMPGASGIQMAVAEAVRNASPA